MDKEIDFAAELKKFEEKLKIQEEKIKQLDIKNASLTTKANKVDDEIDLSKIL